MTFKTIDDFRVRPCAVEYMLLYLSLSSAILLFAAISFLQVHSVFIGLCCLVSASISIFLMSCRIKRHQRAKQFYQEWLSRLTQTQIKEFSHRVKKSSEEYHCIKTLHTNQAIKLNISS
jgi:hypothetical protein